jgi:hypothetical protein
MLIASERKIRMQVMEHNISKIRGTTVVVKL